MLEVDKFYKATVQPDVFERGAAASCGRPAQNSCQYWKNWQWQRHGQLELPCEVDIGKLPSSNAGTEAPRRGERAGLVAAGCGTQTIPAAEVRRDGRAGPERSVGGSTESTMPCSPRKLAQVLYDKVQRDDPLQLSP